MLESSGVLREVASVLRTWELRELPTAWAALLGEVAGSAAVKALPLLDHRLAYLDYEGSISGDRGIVRCCDRGTYELVQQEIPEQEIPGHETRERLTVELAGGLLHGTVRLTCQGQNWTLEPLEGLASFSNFCK